MNKKYPRTFHLPWSPGRTNDDRRMPNVNALLNKTLIITEKMDGSNVCLESNGVFARSHNGPPKHSSFDALKSFYSSICFKIPNDTQIFGEWLYAKHSIHYKALPNYLMLFGVRSDGEWLHWDEVTLWAKDLKVSTVPVLGYCSASTVKELNIQLDKTITGKSKCGGEQEGIVVRLLENFLDLEFSLYVGKWVRAFHVHTNNHWSHQAIIKNILKNS